MVTTKCCKCEARFESRSENFSRGIVKEEVLTRLSG